jgi:hypothetical protein
LVKPDQVSPKLGKGPTLVMQDDVIDIEINMISSGKIK